MFVVSVADPSGTYYSKFFQVPEISVGRAAGNDLILEDDNVSSRHARILQKDGKFIIVDTDSTNGVYVNDRKLTTPVVIAGPDRIHIAVFVLTVSTLRT